MPKKSKLIYSFIAVALLFFIATRINGLHLKLTVMVLAFTPVFIILLSLAKRFLTDEHVIDEDNTYESV